MSKNSLIIILALIIVIGGLACWHYKDVIVKDVEPQDETIGWKIYQNDKFGYSIGYPSDWTYREFPDTKTGAGFRPLSSPAEITSECIVVDERGTAENEYNVPFNEYVKEAAIVEIQNYEKLNSIEAVTAANGIIGYKTTWIYRTMGGQEKISLPITYFDDKKTIETENGQIKYRTVQVVLENEACADIYNQMISTLKILQ
ncbi:MAG: hypothetical protein PHG23_01835 [Candidatus Pacebacteria bacterium]|nr:hypothetical protein [Candidatus Paceibacterota bacterium]